MSGSGVRVVNGLMRVTGAWTGLLTDWLDREGLTAPRTHRDQNGYLCPNA